MTSRDYRLVAELVGGPHDGLRLAVLDASDDALRRRLAGCSITARYVPDLDCLDERGRPRGGVLRCRLDTAPRQTDARHEPLAA